MNNNKLSLGSLRSEVFRVLDEYTSNGVPHEIFSGGTGDIEKRFISALNSAIRLVYLCAARTPVKKRICLEKPDISACAEDFRVLPDGERHSFEVSDGEFKKSGHICVSFDFCGRGAIVVCDRDGNELERTKLNSDFGKVETYKGKIKTENAYNIVFLSEVTPLDIRNLIFFGADGAFGGVEPELLPDGKRVFCRLSDRFYELKGVFCEKNGFIVEMPEETFEVENGILSCEQNFAGEYTVEFFEYPEEIPENASVDTLVCIAPSQADAVIYATAASLCAREDAELYSRLTYKYREYLSNLYPAAKLHLKNSFFSGSIFGRRRKIKQLRG